jgi:hypothetical protein
MLACEPSNLDAHGFRGFRGVMIHPSLDLRRIAPCLTMGTCSKKHEWSCNLISASYKAAAVTLTLVSLELTSGLWVVIHIMDEFNLSTYKYPDAFILLINSSS